MSKKVFLYALSTCGHCRRTKQFLNEKNVEYDYIDVDSCAAENRSKVLDEVKKYNPRCTFPTILIGDQVIVGFKEDEILQALSQS
ncbi:MAG: glutaredoxin family protein [Deltaproteobacteria bacterium]|nr:glutaredoxin family protein [Deltaproteobacteria bacterium]